MKTKTKKTVYQIITDRIIKALKDAIAKGESAPWHKPWATNGAYPINYNTQKNYRGVNVFLLHMMGYESPTWLTFKQAKEAAVKEARADGRDIEETTKPTKWGTKSTYTEDGEPFKGGVKKDEKGTPVVFWNWIMKDANGKTTKDEKQCVKKIPFLKYFTVFNIAQCDGVADKWEKPEGKDHEPIKAAADIVADMPNAPTIEHKEARAYYKPASDTVNMPRLALFDTPEEYHSTLFHELVHSTGHASRLNRDGVTGTVQFGSQNYSKEELIAEMGAAMLCGVAGIDNQALNDNSNAYLRGWISKLNDNPEMAILAGAQAQKAADYIQDIKHDNKG